MDNVALRHYTFGIIGFGLLVACGQNFERPIEPATSAAQSASPPYRIVDDFQHDKGTHPAAQLIEVNGTLYGTTQRGGKYKVGTVYSIDPTGAFKVLHHFGEAGDGAQPVAGLIDVDGTLYGTTENGGTSGTGTVFAISTSGSEEVLYNFSNGSDGGHPLAPVIDVAGTLYGTTGSGGDLNCKEGSVSGCGTVYSLSTSGTEHVLHSFGGGSDGALPFAGLLDVKGVLYGTTVGGGPYYSSSGGDGTVFRITTAGDETVLHSFTGRDGSEPVAALISVNGKLYGTTSSSGKPHIGEGTVFSMSTSGVEKVLHFFTDDKTDGQEPEAPLVDVGGTLYGTTYLGGVPAPYGVGGPGTIFSVSLGGKEKVLYRFSNTAGEWPLAGLIAVDNVLYGTTSVGGTHCPRSYPIGCGTVFAFTTKATKGSR
jgi:uncharacterized repeat protein (TIGR03803 family)